MGDEQDENVGAGNDQVDDLDPAKTEDDDVESLDGDDDDDEEESSDDSE